MGYIVVKKVKMMPRLKSFAACVVVSLQVIAPFKKIIIIADSMTRVSLFTLSLSLYTTLRALTNGTLGESKG